MNECMRGIEKWSVVSITYLATRACPSNYLHHDGPAEVSKYFRRVFHKTLKPELSCSRQSSTVYKKRTVLWDPARRLVLREICTMRKVNEMACIAECHLIAGDRNYAQFSSRKSSLKAYHYSLEIMKNE